MANTVRVDADLVLGVGEYINLDLELPFDDAEITKACLSPTEQLVKQISAASIILQTDQAANIDLLGGFPQTNVRLLVMLTE